MAQILFSNFNNTTLAGAITNTSLSLAVAAGSGALYPSPGTGQYFTGIIMDAATTLVKEIIQVTGRTGDTFTIVRGQQGTTASAYNAGDLLFCGLTAGDMAAFQQYGVADPSNFAVASGTNAYTIAWNLTQTEYVQGNPQGLVLFANANTSTNCTLNDGTGAKTLLRADGQNPAIGDASGYCFVFDDGMNWRFCDLLTIGDILAIIAANQIGLQNPLALVSAAGTYTYTPSSAKVRAILVKGQGPGGGGSASNTTTSSQISAGVPGSAGGYFEHFVVIGNAATYTASYTVGAPGSGGASGGAAGGNGSATSFAGGPTANGGLGGPATSVVATGSYSNTAAVSGGTASGGNLLNRQGGPSQASQFLGSTAYGGQSGSSQNGSPALGYATTAAGVTGSGFGSGGGGGVTLTNANAQNGGNGALGFIQIVEIF